MPHSNNNSLNKSVYVKWMICPKCSNPGALYAIVRESARTDDGYLYYLRIRHDKNRTVTPAASNYCHLPEADFASIYTDSIPSIERKLAIQLRPEAIPLAPTGKIARLSMNSHARNERRRRWKWRAMSLPQTIKFRIERVDAGAIQHSAPQRLKSLYAEACETGEIALKTTVKELTEPERAWIAGLIDGEGSIIRPRDSDTHFSVSIRIEINNNSLELLNRVRETIGSGRVYLPKKNIRRNPCYLYQLSRFDDCITLLLQVRSWLVVKAVRADNALSIASPEVLRKYVEGILRTRSVMERVESTKDGREDLASPSRGDDSPPSANDLSDC